MRSFCILLWFCGVLSCKKIQARKTITARIRTVRSIPISVRIRPGQSLTADAANLVEHLSKLGVRPLKRCYEIRKWRRGKELNPPRTDCPSTVLKTAATTRHTALSVTRLAEIRLIVKRMRLIRAIFPSRRSGDFERLFRDGLPWRLRRAILLIRRRVPAPRPVH